MIDIYKHTTDIQIHDRRLESSRRKESNGKKGTEKSNRNIKYNGKSNGRN